MKVCLVVVGTPGDVLPVLALAKGLKRANHQVRFATSKLYERDVTAANLDFYEMSGNPEGFFGGQGGATLRQMTRQPRRFQRFWNLCMSDFTRRHLQETWDACREHDTAVCMPWFHAASSLTEKLGAPCFATTVTPGVGVPSHTLANPMDDDISSSVGASATLRSWKSSALLTVAPLEEVNYWRTNALGLQPLSRMGVIRSYRQTHFLLSYSASVVPTPTDWPNSIHVTGFWFAEAELGYQPSTELARFLDRHPQPILVGFSSQVAHDPEDFNTKVIQAIVQSGKSAILLTGWGGLRPRQVPERILIQERIPYDWILPRVSAFLHHGGCGSMAQCLRYGVPSMAIPFGFDQNLWGARIQQLGLGPAPMDPDNIDVNALAKQLAQMTEDPKIRSNVREMAIRIRNEDGVQTAINTMEKTLGLSRSAIDYEPVTEQEQVWAH